MRRRMLSIIDKLTTTHSLSKEEWVVLLSTISPDEKGYLFMRAKEARTAVYGNTVYLRGLVELSNHCKKTCLYCGINGQNKKVERYRLTHEEVVQCCTDGYNLGYRTFVLQGGEDPTHGDLWLSSLIRQIKNNCPDAAVTLSLGERSEESYRMLFEAGADRYLLRHETATQSLYPKFHPHQSLANRQACLYSLKRIGFQTGSGFLTGLPRQQLTDHTDDLLFLEELQPQMVGIGPFIPHQQTPMGKEKSGSVENTLLLLACVRLMLPNVLLPATTALNTLDPQGRIKGFEVGANVVMPNLTPHRFRKNYSLYDGKRINENESAEELSLIKQQIADAGYIALTERGDHPLWKQQTI